MNPTNDRPNVARSKRQVWTYHGRCGHWRWVWAGGNSGDGDAAVHARAADAYCDECQAKARQARKMTPAERERDLATWE